MRDPEEGWVNGATYRVMVQDKNHVSLWMVARASPELTRQVKEKFAELLDKIGCA